MSILLKFKYQVFIFRHTFYLEKPVERNFKQRVKLENAGSLSHQHFPIILFVNIRRTCDTKSIRLGQFYTTFDSQR